MSNSALMQSTYNKGSEELTDESMATCISAMQSTYEKGCDELTDESLATDMRARQSIYEKGCDELTEESLATDMRAMQSTYEKGCDDLTDESGATDICAHCAADDKLQPALYFCFQCGLFGRYMCGDCNKLHRKFAFKHEARSVSTAAQHPREITGWGCNETNDESGATDICAHCASENKIEPAFFFCFQCGPFGRFMCGICYKQHKWFTGVHDVRSLSFEEETFTPSKLSDAFLLVAAIYIGTTNSGYAFSPVCVFQEDPLKIKTGILNNGHVMSSTTPTCVLFDKNKKFHSFGFDAEDKYRELICDGENKDYYFFKRTLFDKMLPNGKLMLEDEMGKHMDAMEVFSACIKFLREHLLDKIPLRMFGVEDSKVLWVLTVPRFSNDASKQFMKESAQKAGIDEERLLIATEPEAAIMLARHLPLDSLITPDGRFIPLAKCLVFDAGDSAIKITVHEVKDNLTVRELYKTSDLKLGSTNVDQAFRDFLATIVGNDIMDNFQQNNMFDYNEMFKEFDITKKRLVNNKKGKISIIVLGDLRKTFENAKGIRMSEHLKTKPEYNKKVYWVGDMLRIDPNIAKGLFQETFDKIAEHLKSLFSKPDVKDVQNILMVGEFSESLLLQDFIIKTFPNKRIIIPQDASLSALKGAVILGHVLGRKEQKMKYYNYTHI